MCQMSIIVRNNNMLLQMYLNKTLDGIIVDCQLGILYSSVSNQS